MGMVCPSPPKTKTKAKSKKSGPATGLVFEGKKNKISGSVVDEDLHVVISQTIDTKKNLTPGVHHQAIAKPRGSAEASGSIGWGGVEATKVTSE